MRRGVPDLLFNKGDLRLSLDAQGKELVREVESVPEEHVVRADAEEWAEALEERYAVEAARLLVDQIWREETQRAQVDVSWDHFRPFIEDRSRPAYVPGHRTAVHIPFSGEWDVFQMKPSQYTFNPPRALLGQDELQLPVEYPDDTPANIDAETASLVQMVQQWLGFAGADINGYNASLKNVALSAISARRQRIEQHQAHLSTSTIPVGPPADRSKTCIPDVIKRRPAPVLPSTPPGQPIRLEPVLEGEVFEHILFVIREHTRSMERNPGAYAGMGEEARRHVILDALNTHYRGAGAAEAFNFGGHTDIRVQHEGRNLFVAECKFWDGAAKFTKTVDQFLGYQAWRDTKLAILMFVRERDLTAIIERGRAALEAHPQFVEWQPAAEETELPATVCWKGDDRRHADLNVFFISTPIEK